MKPTYEALITEMTRQAVSLRIEGVMQRAVGPEGLVLEEALVGE